MCNWLNSYLLAELLLSLKWLPQGAKFHCCNAPNLIWTGALPHASLRERTVLPTRLSWIFEKWKGRMEREGGRKGKGQRDDKGRKGMEWKWGRQGRGKGPQKTTPYFAHCMWWFVSSVMTKWRTRYITTVLTMIFTLLGILHIVTGAAESGRHWGAPDFTPR